MRTTLATLAAVVMIWTTSVHGQAVDQCIELLRLSRTSSRTVSSERQFEDAKSHFCDEYSRSRRESRSANYGGSYELLSGSMGTSSSTEDNVASKYCRFESDTREREGSFEEYIEGIDPGAYGAYQGCVAARGDGVQIGVLGDIYQDRLELRVSYVTSVGNDTADLTWRSSAPVNCRVDREGEESGSRRFSLEDNERVVLACSRDNPRMKPVSEPDYVNVVRNNGTAAVSVSWPKYSEQGVPYQTLDDIQRQLDMEVARLRDAVNELEARTRELEQEPDTSFGSWEPVVVGEIHRAESDGFLTALSGGGGNNIGAILLATGESEEGLVVRNRGGQYEGAAIPVKKGHYYQVRMRSGSRGTVDAFWLPVRK